MIAYTGTAMGMWNTGIWQNDTALDWLEFLEDADSWQIVEDTLDGKMEEELCDDEGFCVIAAADVVAAGFGQPSAGFQEEAAAWVSGQPAPDASLARLAVEKVRPLRDDLSISFVDEQSATEWRKSLDELIHRLSGLV